MTNHDGLVPAATKIIKALAGKPGVHFADKTMAADFLAQKLYGMICRGEFPETSGTKGCDDKKQ
jgi:hypothetical protein